jgi:hypothetical protein
MRMKKPFRRFQVLSVNVLIFCPVVIKMVAFASVFLEYFQLER